MSLISLFYAAIILGFMILIHEFGHFAVAKLLGVRVEQFAIGFGKRLVGFSKGETEYRINALPLGGYVKMSGENPMDQRTGDPAEFLSHPRWQRFLIAIAGPTMNIAFAVLLLAGVYMVRYEYPVFMDQPAVVGYVDPDSPAAKIGVERGDRIVRLDGVDNPTWKQVDLRDLLNPNQPLNVVIQRGDQTIQKQLVPQPVTVNEIGWAGWAPQTPIIVGAIEPQMPAAKAGLVTGDKIVAVDGKMVTSLAEMVENMQQTKSKPLDLTLIRGSEKLNVTIQPVLDQSVYTQQKGWRHLVARVVGLGGSGPHIENRWRIGFTGGEDLKVTRLGPAEAFSKSLSENKGYSVMLLELVGKLVQHKVSLRTVSGPIGIVQQVGEAAQEKGSIPLLQLTAAISLNLGIFNLLPIPIMDGGVILLLFIETVMRRDISLAVKERIYQAAFVFLVLFAAMVVYSDIAKTVQSLP